MQTSMDTASSRRQRLGNARELTVRVTCVVPNACAVTTVDFCMLFDSRGDLAPEAANRIKRPLTTVAGRVAGKSGLLCKVDDVELGQQKMT
jgi:hypothetical protein